MASTERTQYPGVYVRQPSGTVVYVLANKWRSKDVRTGERFATPRDAHEARQSEQVDRRRGSHVEPSALSLADYLSEHYLPAIEGTVAPTTLSSYRNITDSYVAPYAIGATTLQGLRPTIFTRHYAELAKSGRRDGKGGLSRKSIANVHALCRVGLNEAVRDGLLLTNPAQHARLPKIEAPRARLKLWSPEQVGRFLAAESADHLRHPLWHCALYTGARRGELLALRWSDVDLKRGEVTIERSLTISDYQIRIGPTKTTTRRTISIDADTVAVLREHNQRQNAWRAEFERVGVLPPGPHPGYVFTLEDGVSHLHPHRVSEWWKRAQGRHRMTPRLRFHDARHVHASMLLTAGVPVAAVSRRLGHSTPVTTMHVYADLLDGQDPASAEAFAAMIREGGHLRSVG